MSRGIDLVITYDNGTNNLKVPSFSSTPSAPGYFLSYNPLSKDYIWLEGTSSATNTMFLDTSQTVTGQKTFDYGTLVLEGTNGTTVLYSSAQTDACRQIFQNVPLGIVYCTRGTDVVVSDGGTGRSSFTKNSVVCGGAALTDALVSVDTSTAQPGYGLTYVSDNAPPVWTSSAGNPSKIVRTLVIPEQGPEYFAKILSDKIQFDGSSYLIVINRLRPQTDDPVGTPFSIRFSNDNCTTLVSDAVYFTQITTSSETSIDVVNYFYDIKYNLFAAPDTLSSSGCICGKIWIHTTPITDRSVLVEADLTRLDGGRLYKTTSSCHYRNDHTLDAPNSLALYFDEAYIQSGHMAMYKYSFGV